MATTKNPAQNSTAGMDVACESEHRYISDTSRYLKRLKRIEGQVSALDKALESVIPPPGPS